MKSGFKLPRLGASPLISQWLLATLGISILAHVDGGWIASKLGLIPSRVWLGEIWRLVTWPLIELGPLSLILTCVVIFRFGGDLAGRWGDAKLQRYVLHVVIGAAAITVLVWTLAGRSRMALFGGWAIPDLLVIAWARQFPTQPIALFYGLLTLHGRQLIGFIFGVVALFAIYHGPVAMAPELAACTLAMVYPTAWLRR